MRLGGTRSEDYGEDHECQQQHPEAHEQTHENRCGAEELESDRRPKTGAQEDEEEHSEVSNVESPLGEFLEVDPPIAFFWEQSPSERIEHQDEGEEKRRDHGDSANEGEIPSASGGYTRTDSANGAKLGAVPS